MALSFGQTGTAEPLTAEYLTRQSDDGSLRIHMHLDAVDAIARDAVEGFKSLPRRGVEIGGLLLGRVDAGSQPTVWIERFQRVECKHRFGPQFVLDDEDHVALERSANEIARAGELNVVGFYRSHTRSGFQLEEADFELVERYFTDSSDLILLIQPRNMLDVTAQFFARRSAGEMKPAGTIFPFRGRVVGPAQVSMEKHTQPEADDIEPDTARTNPPERGRRLVPDFDDGEPPRKTPRESFMAPRAAAPPDDSSDAEDSGPAAFIRRWWPFLCALVLATAAVLFLLLPKVGHRGRASVQPVADSAAPIRPLGLYVDPSGDNWRVSWNPAATALNQARGVELFVRDGDDQNRIDLTPGDLQTGTYQYPPKGQDVTFRLEVTDSRGQIAAESFRFERLAGAAPNAAVAAAAPVAPPPPAVATRPKPIHRAAPVVPASIRPRIRGTIPVDIRVKVDAMGRVVSAVPVKKAHQGLESYLADRAVTAARQWRFAPDSPGAETIHFVFER